MFKMFTIRRQARWNKANTCTHIFLIYLLSVRHPESSSYITNTSNFHFKMNRKNGKTSFPILHIVKREIRLIFMQLT